MTTTILQPINSSFKSFNGKAVVITDNNKISLKSYDTIVAYIIGDKATVTDTYSATTLRHIKEFLKQNGFKANNKAQILQYYT